MPPDQAALLPGFDIGFGILASLPDYQIELDSVRFTHCSYSVNHLDTASGVETPVLQPNGAPLTESISTFGAESTQETGPVLFTTPVNYFSTFGGTPNSPTGDEVVGTTVNNVGVTFVTKLRFKWGSIPDLTRPELGKGYVVHFDIRFVPTYFGIEYPEVKVKANHRDDVSFVYQVIDVPVPQFVDITPFAWENMPGGTDRGVTLRMSGTHLEYFKLQRSPDMVTWTDWPFYGEGNDWAWPYTLPADDVGWGFWPNVYEWTLFDMNYPNERRIPQREFYRMVWTGKRGTWRIWSPTQERPW